LRTIASSLDWWSNTHTGWFGSGVGRPT